MAHLENIGPTTHDRFVAEIRAMPDAQLVAQDLVQQGSIHIIGWLLQRGVTERNAIDALASLLENARLIREEAKRRGKQLLFDRDQTGHS